MWRRPGPRTATLWLVLAVGLAGCGSGAALGTESGSPGVASPAASAPPSADPIAAGRRADLEQLLERLVALHPNPFLDEGEAGFRARLDDLAARSGDLTDAGFLVGVMALMGARDRDGHSGAWHMAQTGERLHAWPVWLWDFPDGLRIVAAKAPYDDLIGARILEVGGTPVAEARAAVEPLVPRDNPTNLRGNLPAYLTLPEVLAERGVLQAGAPSLRLEMPDGSIRDVDPVALPIEAYRDWVFERYGGYPTGFPPDPDGTASQQHRGAIIWSEPLDAGGTYVAYNQVQPSRGSEGTTISDVARELTAATRAGASDAVIIDLRNNPGGNNTTYGPLRSAVETYALANPGRVALLTGRTTFSAAGNFVTDLAAGPAGDAIRIVGEPTGGGPNIYGDVRVVTLESSGVVVLISTRWHERRPGDDRLEVEPDIAAEVSWADLVAGRDPVLEAAIEATARAR